MSKLFLQNERIEFAKKKRIISQKVSIVTVAYDLPEDIDIKIINFIGLNINPPSEFNDQKRWYSCNDLDISWKLLMCYISMAGKFNDMIWYITYKIEDVVYYIKTLRRQTYSYVD